MILMNDNNSHCFRTVDAILWARIVLPVPSGAARLSVDGQEGSMPRGTIASVQYRIRVMWHDNKYVDLFYPTADHRTTDYDRLVEAMGR
jgi:hypothetical protein